MSLISAPVPVMSAVLLGPACTAAHLVRDSSARIPTGWLAGWLDTYWQPVSGWLVSWLAVTYWLAAGYSRPALHG